MNFEIDGIIEIPSGSKFKYEVDKKTGTLVVDRPLMTELPYNYGYVPSTLHSDGDPLDVVVIDNDPIQPLTRVKLVLLGALICTDNGCSDDKLIAVVKGNEIYSQGMFLNSRVETVWHYLDTYKEGFVVHEFVDAEAAHAILMKDVEAFLDA